MDTLLKESMIALRAADTAALAGLRIVLIILAAWILSAALRRLIRLLHQRVVNRVDDVEATKRAGTLERVLRHVVTLAVSLVAGILILSELGVSVAPILGAAGIVGIAVGFGAQSLVKDYFTGFCILIENQIRQGDIVDVAGKSGLVEEITLRYVRLRDYEGNVHYVPNGLITTVTNRTRGYAHAVIDVSVGYGEDIDTVFKVMRDVADAFATDTEFSSKILGPLEIAGIENWAESAVSIRCRFKVAPLEQAPVRREYLRRLKKAFDAAGIEIPFRQLTIHSAPDRKQAMIVSNPEEPARS